MPPTMNPRSLRRSLPAPLLAAALLAPGALAQTAPDTRSSRADYVLKARVEPHEKRLEGVAQVTWENRSADEVGDLWFHLHLNAYSNNLTTHMWESEGKLRDFEVEEGWGWQRITSMKVGEADLLPTLAYQRPDDGREQDHTVFSVQLPEPVPPGGSVTVDLTWDSLLPRVRRRTGVKDDFILLAHWFPKLGVYESGRGWNCHQFHMNTEFYSDYGTYEVTLDLPAEYDGKIGASGVQVGAATVTGERVVTRFAAPSPADRSYADPVATGFADPHPVVHGFAWTADPDYVRIQKPFSFDEWKAEFPIEVAKAEAAFGVPLDSLRLRDVNVVVLIQPEREGQAERHYRATCAALFFYGLWFGEYPYEQVTVVDPAWGARGAGGMEYPTLFTCGTRLFSRPAMYTPESVTVHECGHQFWYALVGNNEYEDAWLDEGFNSYADSEAMIRTYGLQRSSTSYSGLPVWGIPVAAEPAATGISGILTGQRWDFRGQPEDADDGADDRADDWATNRADDRPGLVLAPLAPTPFLDWWRDQPWLSFAEDQRDPRWGDRSGYLAVPDADPVHTAGWRYLNRQSYRTNSYPRPAVILRSLPAVVGDTAFLKGMRHYSGKWRYRHPQPDDFYEAFNEGAGVDVSWYFDELFEGTGTVNWSVDVSQRRSPEPRGFFLVEGQGYVEVVPEDDPEEDPEEDPAEDPGEAPGEAPGEDPEEDEAPESEADGAGNADVEQDAAPPGEDPGAVPDGELDEQPEEAQEDEEDEDERPWLYDVAVRRRGTLRLPLVIEVGFADGSTRRFEWTREMQEGVMWWRLPIDPGSEKIERVILDPQRRYYLDTDMSDNQWYSERDSVAPARWSERAFTQYAHLLHWFSSLGG